MTARFASAQEFIEVVSKQSQGIPAGINARRALRAAVAGEGFEVLSALVRRHVGDHSPSFVAADTYPSLLEKVIGEVTTGAEGPAHYEALSEFLSEYDFIAAPVAKNDKQAESTMQAEAVPYAGADDRDPLMDALDALLTGDDLVMTDSMPSAEDRTPNGGNNATKNEKTSENREQKLTNIGTFSPGTADLNRKETAIVPKTETKQPEFDPLSDLGDAIFEKHWGGITGQGEQRISSGELMKLPGILPPPPKNGSPENYGSWLEGDIWNPLSISIKLDLKDSDNLDDLIEMQSEFYALPESAVQTYSARPPADPEAGRTHARFIHSAARDLGQMSHTYDQGHALLAKAVARYFEENEPRAAEFLGRVGYFVRCDAQLVDVVCGALDIEKFFISNGPADAGEGALSDIRGAVSSFSRLDVTYLLDRAVLLHFGSGQSLSTGLHNTLIELRHAQLCRHIERELSPFEFDPAFKRDWFTELDEYELVREEDHSPSPM